MDIPQNDPPQEVKFWYCDVCQTLSKNARVNHSHSATSQYLVTYSLTGVISTGDLIKITERRE